MDKKESSKSFGAKQIAMTGILLAICIVSQVFKNLSIFITGPIINACLVLAVMMANLPCALALCVITPVTAFFIAASPVMMAVPGIVPLIMAGNAVLVVSFHFLLRKDLTDSEFPPVKPKHLIKAVICAALKGLFMGLTIALWLLPTFISPESKIYKMMPVFQKTFSLYQFLTACIGFVYVFFIFAINKHIPEQNNN
ncbi:MAG: ECF transporter S component [Lachnospiraceae bacterium]|nr:ECF transporter S component [Lachnospiraceae bacterium]